MKRIYFFLIILSIFGCNQKIEINKESIDYVDVYYIPFDILAPIETTEHQIELDIYKKTLNNKTKDSVCEYINKLEEINDIHFNEDNISLRLDFFDQNTKVLKVLCDKNSFRINGNNYKMNEDFLSFINMKYK
jgi:hypothetical protein